MKLFLHFYELNDIMLRSEICESPGQFRNVPVQLSIVPPEDNFSEVAQFKG